LKHKLDIETQQVEFAKQSETLFTQLENLELLLSEPVQCHSVAEVEKLTKETQTCLSSISGEMTEALDSTKKIYDFISDQKANPEIFSRVSLEEK